MKKDADEEEIKSKLINKLKNIFQLDSEYLDFGIYRIMNYKKKEIEKFIEKDLIESVNKQLKVLAEKDKKEIEDELKDLKKAIKKAYGDDAFKNGDLRDEFKKFPLGEEYTEKLELLNKIKISKDMEIDIYNHVYSFFSRYYDKGDFLGQRRYSQKGKEKYVIPYDGDEVLFYWANKDQYYIKTTEMFKKYTFISKSLTVNFRISKIDIGEEGKRKYFVISEDAPCEINGKILNIYFEYRGLRDKEKNKKKFGKKSQISQSDVNKFNLDILDNFLKNKKETETLFKKYNGISSLEKNMNKYTKRNTSDYFIHTQIGNFLDRELDFYIKNEVLKFDLDELDNESMGNYLLKARVVSNISKTIIQFLCQLENFQKNLWEKKKFIIDVQYIITLDKIKEYAGEKFLKGILEDILNNKNQTKEWNEFFNLKVKNEKDLIENNNLNGPTYKKFPLDTKYFEEEFKWKLITAISQKSNEGLEKVVNGILIKSENWQALNILLNKWKEKIDTVYIDPPYNTGSDDFLYKDKYQHSSWLTFMNNRLKLAKDLLKKDGNIFISIANNDNYYKESYKLGLILGDLFEKRFADLIWKRRGGSGSYAISDITEIHEYILSWGKGQSSIFTNILSPKKIEEYKHKDEKGNYKWHDLVIHQYTKEERENLYYGVVYNFKNDKLNFSKDPKKIDPSKEIAIYPSEDGNSVFIMTKKSMEEVNERGILKVMKNKNDYRIKIKKYLEDERGIINGNPLKSILNENRLKYKIGGTYEATRELNDILGFKFETAKPSSLIKLLIYISTLKRGTVLDFFAGSGTTAHSVMKLNSEDGGNRKFILVDMGEHFNSIIIPRIKKIAYSFDWKNTEPTEMNGLGGFFKYYTLEQYGDSLENIEFKQKSIDKFSDYFIGYMLDFESKESKIFLNLNDMKNPFDYKIKILDKDGSPPKKVKVDLIETFNYLIGLEVDEIREILKDRRYLFISGNVKNVKTLIIWRSIKNIDFEKDKEIIENIIREFKPDEIFINGDSGVENSNQIESRFKSLL